MVITTGGATPVVWYTQAIVLPVDGSIAANTAGDFA